jgi:phosphonate transport system substrate-binding protein
MRQTARWLVLALGVAVLVIAGCRRDEHEVGSRESPLVLVLSNAHGGDAARVKELHKLLEQASGMSIEVRVAPNSEAAVRMAGSPNTDAALLTVFDYLFCRQLFGVKAALRVVRKGGAKSHHGEIVARRSSDLRTLQDLQGKRIAYVDRYSSTGYLLAAKLLADAHVRVDPVFSGTHENAIAALKSGKTAAAATYADAVAGDVELTVLAETPELPNEPLAFRKDLDADKRKRLVDAFTQVASDPEGKRVLEGIANIEGFAPTSDAEYVPAAELINSIGKSVKDVVPRGWTLSNEQERRPGDLAP